MKTMRVCPDEVRLSQSMVRNQYYIPTRFGTKRDIFSSLGREVFTCSERAGMANGNVCSQ